MPIIGRFGSQPEQKKPVSGPCVYVLRVVTTRNTSGELVCSSASNGNLDAALANWLKNNPGVYVCHRVERVPFLLDKEG